MNNTFSEVNVKPSVQFYWAFLGAGLMHIVFFIIFLLSSYYLMAFINFLSIIFYIAGFFVNRKRISAHAVRWVIGFFFEVLLYSVLSTVLQGVEVCGFLYPLMAMPIYGYLLFSFCDREKLVRMSLFMAITTFVVGAVVLICVDHFGTIYSITGMRVLTREDILLMRFINIAFATIMLLVFTIVFYMELMKTLNMLIDLNKKLDYTATHDQLTGLSNRYSLWKFVERLENSGDEYCVFLGDLDDFKKINDTFGHDCGDKVLKFVASIILENSDSEKDIACRWGGEEMLVVMRGSRDKCIKIVQDIKDKISELDLIENGKHVKVSMTFGFVDNTELLTLSPPPTEVPAHYEMNSLISIADKRLYVGKKSGKNVIIAA